MSIVQLVTQNKLRQKLKSWLFGAKFLQCSVEPPLPRKITHNSPHFGNVSTLYLVIEKMFKLHLPIFMQFANFHCCKWPNIRYIWSHW